MIKVLYQLEFARIKILKSSLLLFILITVSGYLSGRPDTVSFDAMLAGTNPKALPDERVMVKTDRDIYLCGEDILMSAYTYEGNWFTPVSISSVLYVEFYNPENHVFSRMKLLMKKGKGTGQIGIPRNVATGIYYLRAYTNYMKNFGIKQFFLKKLKIVNPFVESDFGTFGNDSAGIIHCDIYPEGGGLLSGFQNRIGCRFTDGNGNGLQVTARLKDSNNNVIADFKTYKSGFASFEFTPISKNSYSIEAVSSKSNAVFPVPPSSESVSLLSIDSVTPDYIKIKVLSADRSRFPLRLSVIHGNMVYPWKDSIIHSAGTYRIFRDGLQSGLVTLLLSDNQANTLSARALYYNPVNPLKITLQSRRSKYGNGEKIKVCVKTSDKKGSPVKTGLVFFVALTETDTVNNKCSSAEKEIMIQEFRHLYPEYEDIMSDAFCDDRLLDLILLSAKMRVSNKPDPVSVRYLPETTGDLLTGKLIYSDNEPARGIEILQSFTGWAGCIESAKTDKNGKFIFLTNNEKNQGDLIFKLENAGNGTILIPDNEFFDIFPPPRKEAFHLNRNEADLVAHQFINIQVEDAFPKKVQNNKYSADPESLPFYGKSYTEYKFSDYAKLPNMKEFIFELIVGIITSKENKKEVISILDADNNNKIGPHPLMMVDGIPVTDASIILALNPEKVKTVRVVRSRYFYKKQIFDGILDILTYDGDARIINLPEDTFRYGFTHPGERNLLTEPAYDQKDDGQVPVYRNLLYWNSEIQTDTEGKAEVTFYSPDNNGKFTIGCFGFTEEGLAGEGRCHIMVGDL